MEHNENNEPLFIGSITEQEFAKWLHTAFTESVEYSARVALRLRMWNIELDVADKGAITMQAALILRSSMKNYTTERLRYEVLAHIADLMKLCKTLNTKYAPTDCQCSTCVMLDIDYECVLELIAALAAVEVTA